MGGLPELLMSSLNERDLIDLWPPYCSFTHFKKVKKSLCWIPFHNTVLTISLKTDDHFGCKVQQGSGCAVWVLYGKLISNQSVFNKADQTTNIYGNTQVVDVMKILVHRNMSKMLMQREHVIDDVSPRRLYPVEWMDWPLQSTVVSIQEGPSLQH